MPLLPIMLQWVFTNFGLFMFGIALVIIFIQSIHRPVLDYLIIYRWIALLPLGITALYAFIMHAFFPEVAAKTIGWQNSPFQYEVAMANLSIGVIAVYSFFQNQGFRLATVMATTCWLWGDASGHIFQMITQHNFSAGNAGSWFYMDVLIPLLLMICIKKIDNQPHS